MKKNQSAWDEFIFILFQIQKNSFQDITKVHRSKFLTRDFELLGLSYVSLFDRSDSSGTYESIIQNRLQRLSSDNVRLLTTRKGEGIYGIDTEEGTNRLNETLHQTREHFRSLKNVFFYKDIKFLEQENEQFMKTIKNVHYAYKNLAKYDIIEGYDYEKNIYLLESWIDTARFDLSQCKKNIALEIQNIIKEALALLEQLKMKKMMPELQKQNEYLNKIIYDINS
jgi:hypothetical protein